ncbi:MAG TPA: hypothetical protein VGH54_09395, partial [Mycobacterium sp.]
MKNAIGVAAAGVLAAVVLAGCGGGGTPKAAPATVTATVTVTPKAKPTPVEATCRNAIRVDYENGWTNKSDPYPPSTRKPVCAGFDRPTLQRLMDEAIADITNGTTG